MKDLENSFASLCLRLPKEEQCCLRHWKGRWMQAQCALRSLLGTWCPRLFSEPGHYFSNLSACHGVPDSCICPSVGSGFTVSSTLALQIQREDAIGFREHVKRLALTKGGSYFLLLTGIRNLKEMGKDKWSLLSCHWDMIVISFM